MIFQSLSAPAMFKVFFSLLLVSFRPMAGASENRKTPAEYIARADHYTDIKWQEQKSLDMLHRALEKYPRNDEILWRISRCHIAIAEMLNRVKNGEDHIVKDHYQQARQFAEKAIDVNPENSMAHTQYAIASGQLGMHTWAWSAIRLVNKTRDAAAKAIDLDESNHIAHFVYARTHYEVTKEVPWVLRRPLGFRWADTETAHKHFIKAVELSPGFIMYRYYAALAFMEAGNHRLVEELLSVIPELNSKTRFDESYRKKAETLLNQL